MSNEQRIQHGIAEQSSKGMLTFEVPFLAPGELCSATAGGFSTARLRRWRASMWAEVDVLGSICKGVTRGATNAIVHDAMTFRFLLRAGNVSSCIMAVCNGVLTAASRARMVARALAGRACTAPQAMPAGQQQAYAVVQQHCLLLEKIPGARQAQSIATTGSDSDAKKAYQCASSAMRAVEVDALRAAMNN